MVNVGLYIKTAANLRIFLHTANDLVFFLSFLSLLLTIPDIHKLYSVDQFPGREVLHQCEGEPFAAQVLEGCPDVVDLIVDK